MERRIILNSVGVHEEVTKAAVGVVVAEITLPLPTDTARSVVQIFVLFIWNDVALTLVLRPSSFALRPFSFFLFFFFFSSAISFLAHSHPFR